MCTVKFSPLAPPCLCSSQLLHRVEADFEWGIDRDPDFLSPRQQIGKDRAAEAVDSKADSDGRDHACGNSGGKTEFEIGAQHAGQHVVFGRSDNGAAHRLRTEVQSTNETDASE